MTGPKPILWGGLDFDTAELDTDVRGLLEKLIPADGDARQLRVSASVRAAHAAVEADLSLIKSRRREAAGCDMEDVTREELALQHLVGCLSWLSEAQERLSEAEAAYQRAKRAMEGR